MGRRAIRFLFALVLVYGACWPVLGFSPVFDDWVLHWGAKYDLSHIQVYWLHPASMLEVILLARYIPLLSSMWWHIGILLKAATAYAVGSLAYRLFGSKRAMWLSTALYAAVSLGNEAVSFVSAHTVYISAILLCYALIYFLQYIQTQKRKYFIYVTIFVILSLLADPFRGLLIFVYVSIILLCSQLPLVQIKKIGGLCIVSACLFTGVFLYIYRVSLFESNATRIPLLTLVKYACTYMPLNLGRMLGGWVVPIVSSDVLWLNISCIALGYVLLIYSVLASVQIVRTVIQRVRRQMQEDKGNRLSTGSNKWIDAVRISVLILVLSYIPNWLFQPRVYLQPDNRYFALPAVGFVMLVTQILLVKKGVGLWVSGIFLCVLMAVGTRMSLSEVSLYRYRERLVSMWMSIDADVVKPEKTVLYFSGNGMYNAYYMSGISPHPVAIWRNIRDITKFPKTIYTEFELAKELCLGDMETQVLSYDIQADSFQNTTSIMKKKFNTSYCVQHSAVPQGDPLQQGDPLLVL